eukprot:TRINITY_DN1627_c6_g1_i1.p2 TRINITY_DN1627_c6_g1~~TRINITY_DN1627_c6_g1_i1.p2  ORF type:complete len:634 (+),score=248.38 TRINITY_DN1627_c6_g1_i1:126-1904(+)
MLRAAAPLPALARHGTAARGQLRRGAAAAYPQEPAPQRDAPPNRAAADLTPRQRANYRLGPSNRYPGHEYQFNVYDRDDSALPDPVTGWSPDEVPDSVGRGGGNEKTALTPAPVDTAGLSSIQKAVLALKLSPPVDFAQWNHHERFNLGRASVFMGGSLDPQLRLADLENRGFINTNLYHINESADGIVECVMEGGRVEEGVMYQKMEDSARKLQVFQVPFSQKREEQGFKDMPLVAGGKYIDPVQPGRIEQEMHWHYGATGLGFVVDGAASSCKDDEVRIRVYTDNSAHALFWTHLLQSIPGRNFQQMSHFRPPVVLYHAPGFTFEPDRIIEEFGGPKPKDLGLESEKFVLVDPYCKPAMAVVSGELSLDVARNTLAYLVGIVAFEELDVLTLPADALLNPDGSATIYFGAPESIRASPNLYGGHHLGLSPDGLSYMWDAATKPLDKKELKPLDLVTEQGGQAQHTAPLLRRIGDPTSRPKPRSLHWDSLCGRSQHVKYESANSAEGMKFAAAPAAVKARHRPNSIPTDKVNVVFCDGGKAGQLSADQSAAKFVAAVKAGGFPYASDDELASSWKQAVERGLKCATGAPPK